MATTTDTTALDFNEIHINSPISRAFVEETVIKNFDQLTFERHVLGLQKNVRFPNYPTSWFKKPITRYATGFCSVNGKLSSFVKLVEGRETQDKRLSIILHRENEGLLMCVEYRRQFVVILIDKFTYVYVNGHLLFLDRNIGPCQFPFNLLHSGAVAVQYIQIQYQFLVSLFKAYYTSLDDM